MENTNNIPDPDNEHISEQKFTDKNTADKIHKHLSDSTDVISEEDIRNVKTDFRDSTGLAERSIEELPNENDKVKDEAGVNDEKDNPPAKEHHPQITPWDLLK